MTLIVAVHATSGWSNYYVHIIMSIKTSKGRGNGCKICIWSEAPVVHDWVHQGFFLCCCSSFLDTDPACLDEIKIAEQKIKGSLPGDLRCSLQIHNGQEMNRCFG